MIMMMTNLYILLSEAVSLPVLDELQDGLDVLVLRADRVTEDLGGGRPARDAQGKPRISHTQRGLDDVLHLGAVGGDAGPGPDLLRPRPGLRLLLLRAEERDLPLRLVDVQVEVVGVHGGGDAGGHLVHQLGLVVGFADQVTGEVLQHVPLVGVDGVLD